MNCGVIRAATFLFGHVYHRLPLNKDEVEILEHIWGSPSSRKRDHIYFPAFLVLAQSGIKLFSCRPLCSRDQHPKRLGGVALVEEFFEMPFQHTAEMLSAVQRPWKVGWEVGE